MPRSTLSGGLQTRLRIRITVADLREFKDELDSVFQNLQIGKVHSWNQEIAAKQEALQETVRMPLLNNIRWGKTGLRAGGIGLENLVAELLSIDGFAAQVIGYKKTFKGRADADIKASRHHILGSEEFLIQVKHHDGTTARWGVEQLIEVANVMPEFAERRLALVTSGDIADDDRSYAEERGVSVIDGNALAEWIFSSVPKLRSETKLALGISEVPQLLA